MNIFLLLSFFALELHAQSDYQLIQAENDSYRDYTIPEFIQRMGPNASLIPQYVCNGQNEFELFWPAIRSNEDQDSLRIKFQKEDKVIVYRQGKFYKLNGDKQRDLTDPFVIAAKKALKKIENVPEGQMLLRHLERSYFPITLALGGNSFNSKEENGVSWRGIYMATAISEIVNGRMTSSNIPFYDVGVGGIINWTPFNEELPSYIVLAHEMYHAFDSIRGLMDSRVLKGNSFESTQVSEYRATFMENIFRKSAGLPYRTHYGDSKTGPGLLDINGQPRLIPSPCLKSI